MVDSSAGCLVGVPATSSAVCSIAMGPECGDRLDRAKAMMARRLSVVSYDGDELQFSGQLVAVRAGDYDYVDSREALLGVGSYGAVFRGVDRRAHRKPSVYNNTSVRGDAVSTTADNDRQNVSNETVDGVTVAPRAVAVKKVARTSLKSNELRAMKRVRHPNLVRLIDICNAIDPAVGDEEDGCGIQIDNGDNSPFTYLIMELCDTDLDRYLRRHTADGRLPMEELIRVVECIACGYLALYEKRIVHRDIKPQNILLNYSSVEPLRIANAKITDFGISRIYETIDGDDFCDYDPMNNVVGTFYYMAPEVGANLLRLSEYDYSADLWSIGCLIYQCLTGHIPFDESSMCRLFLYCAGANYDAYDPPDLPEPTSEDSQALNALITGLLQIDREKRATPQQLHAYAISRQAQAQDGTGEEAKLQPNFSFASLSSVLSSTSTLGENSTSSQLATPMISSSDGE